MGTDTPIIFHPLPQDDPKQRCPDITKAKRILNWEPKVKLEDGLQTTYEYFKNKVAQTQAAKVTTSQYCWTACPFRITRRAREGERAGRARC